MVTPLGLAVTVKLTCGRGELPMHVQSLRMGLHNRMVQRLHCGWVGELYRACMLDACCVVTPLGLVN
jgi:hypothetical protein